MNRTTIVLAATMSLGSLALAPGGFAGQVLANGSTAQEQQGNAQQTADADGRAHAHRSHNGCIRSRKRL